MSRFTDSYFIINRRVEKVEKFIAVLIISLIVLIIFSATVSRYLFNASLFGAERISTYLMIWLGFLGFQIATSRMRHIEVGFITQKVNPRTRYILNFISELVSSMICLIFSVLSISFLLQSLELGDKDIVLEIPIWIIILILPLSFFLSAVRFFISSFLWIDVLKGLRKEEEFVKKEFL